jgi:hypothetical protein
MSLMVDPKYAPRSGRPASFARGFGADPETAIVYLAEMTASVATICKIYRADPSRTRWDVEPGIVTAHFHYGEEE